MCCKKRHICNDTCKLKCSECVYCNQYCKDFVKYTCPSLTRIPFVCNNCQHYSSCKLERHYYDAKVAHEKYKYTLTDSRAGVNMTTSELKIYQQKLKEGLDKGQSFEATIITEPDIHYSVRSAYRHLHDGLFDEILPIDLRDVTKRKIKLNRRNKSPEEIAAFREAKKGRDYEDFTAYLAKHPDYSVVEMDTVVGKRNEPYCLLTFYIRKANFFLAFKLEKHDAEAVVSKLDEIHALLGEADFKRIFKIILTDNGSEFSNVERIEHTNDNKKRCSLFFCDPMASGQKGRLENSHRLVRYVYPKSTSFKDATNEDITLMCNHINNYPRRRLYGSIPFTLAKAFLRTKPLNALGMIFIEAKNVLLKPKLVKHK